MPQKWCRQRLASQGAKTPINADLPQLQIDRINDQHQVHTPAANQETPLRPESHW